MLRNKQNDIDMNSNKNIPQLRFPEFKGEWDEKVLSECLEERNEQFPENENYPLMAFVAGRGVSPKGEKYDRSALVKDAPTWINVNAQNKTPRIIKTTRKLKPPNFLAIQSPVFI